MKRLIISYILFFALTSAVEAFRHPGLLHTQESITRMQTLIAQNNNVAMGSYTKLKNDIKTSNEYIMAGPYSIIARDGKYNNTKKECEDDFLSAYYNALMFNITSDHSHAVKSLEIIRAYTTTLKSIQGHDAPLCAALQGFILINACELLRYDYDGWTKNDSKNTETMFRKVFMPILDEFDKQSPYANGNWGVAVNKMRMAIGVYCNDKKQYHRAIDFFYNANDNGALPNYISSTGQCQESGRDQAHTMLGLGQMSEICEMAWSQGDDLWGALDNRLLAGYEYTSMANLGYDVPFTTWKDKTGHYCNWTVLSEGALGKWRSVFEIAYNHYVGRKHLKMPYTSKVLGHFVRPEGAGFACDNPGFGTLLFYQYTDVDSTSQIPHIRQYKTNIKRAYSVLTEPVIKMENAPNLTLVRNVDCWPEYWDLQPIRCNGNTYEYDPHRAMSRNGYTFSDAEVNTTFIVKE